MTTLPESFEAHTIEKMLPGDKGYTVPWAMYADQDRQLWINGSYTVEEEAGGPVHLEIERTATGIIVTQKSIRDHRYDPGPPCYAGMFEPIEVERLR